MSDKRKKIYEELLLLGKTLRKSHIREFKKEELEQRVIKNDLLQFDYSKQRINDESIDYLLQIPELIKLNDLLKELFAGKFRNVSEKRYVSHTLYRDETFNNDFEFLSTERERIKSFIQEQENKKVFKKLICISIGGSRLGPELLNEFQSFNERINVQFCSSDDLLELNDVLRKSIQGETLIFISSKSFETTEVLKNLNQVKSWFLKASNVDIQNHLYGISSNSKAMSDCGIKLSNQFLVLDSLGGRFSLWSSMSLPAFVNSGFDSYLELLEGARLADKHASSTSWESNIPVIMALLSIWNATSLGINNHGIFTYNFRLRSLTKYLAQLSMESNGKSINYESKESPFPTSPLIWGGYGIELQHSTFQWMMQGKTETSCDFIGINSHDKDMQDSYLMLLSQVLAMTQGKNFVKSPYKSIKGNNPCSILQMKSLDLRSLGFLLATYEHKVFIEAAILGINPFDQWGVQLGKELLIKAKKKKEFLKDHFSSEFLPKT